ncbi:hypothetical protein [uncultured Brevundimonas sp.]
MPRRARSPSTTAFTASTPVLATAKVGDRVAFDVSVHDGVNEITALRPQ